MYIFNWNAEKLENDFFEKENYYKIQSGIILSQNPEIIEEDYCIICYEDINNKQFSSLNCKHTFCDNCWKNYLEIEVI